MRQDSHFIILEKYRYIVGLVQMDIIIKKFDKLRSKSIFEKKTGLNFCRIAMTRFTHTLAQWSKSTQF